VRASLLVRVGGVKKDESLLAIVRTCDYLSAKVKKKIDSPSALSGLFLHRTLNILQKALA
jgi:hypothetical protein